MPRPHHALGLLVCIAGCTGVITGPADEGSASDQAPPDQQTGGKSDDPTGGGQPSETGRVARLHDAETWMYQIQDLYEESAWQTLDETPYPMLVVEPGHNFAEWPYDTPAMIETLRETPTGDERLLLAYIDVGQAEEWRDYWGADWVAPSGGERGSPDFLVAADPDGWEGNYPVAYWRPGWKEIWLGEGGIVAELAELGFDGVYLDWIEAYDDARVQDAAAAEGVDEAIEMIRFIEEIRAAGREVTPDFLVVAQNSPFLIDAAPDRYAQAIDALAVEDTWWHGAGDAAWNDPDAGDLHERHDGRWSTPSRLEQYEAYKQRGLPVFSVDYCISEENAAQVYQDARAEDLRPLVTRVSLSRLTEDPPWDY